MLHKCVLTLKVYLRLVGPGKPYLFCPGLTAANRGVYLNQHELVAHVVTTYYSCCFPVCDRAAAQRGSVVRHDGYVVSPPSGRRGSGGEGCQAGAVVVPAGAGLMPSAPC